MHGIGGEVLGVESQVVLLAEGLHGGLRSCIKAHLQRGAIFNQPGDLPPDHNCGFGRSHRLDGQQVFFVLQNIMDVVDVNETLPHDPGHTRIDLGDDQIGGIGRRTGDVHGYPQAHPAEIIRGRHLDQGYVDGQFMSLEKPGHIGNVHGCNKAHVMRKALGAGRPQIDVPNAEIVLLGFIGDLGERGTFLTHHAHDLDTCQPGRVVRQGPHQFLGLAAGRTYKNALPRFDELDGFINIAFFFNVTVSPVGYLGHGGTPYFIPQTPLLTAFGVNNRSVLSHRYG